MLLCTAVLEGVLRRDVAWRPFVLAEAVALVLALPWRRTYPLPVVAAGFGTVIVVELVALASGTTGDVGLNMMVFLILLPYALFRWAAGREAAIGTAIVFGAYVLGITKDRTSLGDAVGGLLVLALPAALGLSMRFRSTSRVRELDQARLRERELLARELHDTVAHHVSAMVIRAQAGRVVAASRPAAAVEALEIIEAEGTRTLAEMRTIVGALRGGEEAQLAPLGGIADIERLGRAAGERPDVRVELSGMPDQVSPAVEIALYRIAQEAVTNAIRHARDPARIIVELTGQGDRVRLTVRDDGDPVPGIRPADGYGIVGMMERAKLLGGTLEAGPGPERGWVVEAVLPVSGPGG